MTAQTPDVRGLSRDPSEARSQMPMPSRRWKTRVLPPVLIAVCVLGLLAYSAWDEIMPAVEVRAVPVVLKSVAGQTPGSVTVQAPGWLEPDPHPHFVAALTTGVVKELLVLEGQRVEAGEVVARLIDDDAKLERERAAAVVEERASAVAVAEAELEAATKTLETLVDRNEDTHRARADLAAVAAERAKLDADIEAADASMRATKDEFDRKQRLVESQAVSRGEVERLRLRLAADRAQLDSKRAAIPVLEARHDAAKARMDAAVERGELLIDERRAVSLAEARLRAARAAHKKSEVELGEAELRLDRTSVRTSVGGIVLERFVSPGSDVRLSGVAHSSHVVHLYDPQKLQVRVDVPLVDASQIQVDQRAEVVVDALPDAVFEGVVTRLVHLADVAKNTVEVKVAVRSPEPVLKPEMLARVRFLAERPPATGGESPQRVFAPSSAVVRGEGGTRVLVVAGLQGGRGRVAIRPVTVGTLKVEDHVEITSGLRPGDHVLVDPPAGLTEGARIALTGGGH